MCTDEVLGDRIIESKGDIKYASVLTKLDLWKW